MKIDEKTGLYENYGSWHVPFWQTDMFLLMIKVVALGCVFLLLFFLCRMYIQKHRRKKLPAWDQALLDLESSREFYMLGNATGKDFYGAITVVMKRYLYDRFNYDVIGKTDEELIVYLQKNQCIQDIVDELAEVVRGSVFVKFANQDAVVHQIHKDYDRCVAIIKRTMPEKQKR